MPELPELRICADFINHHSKHKFIKVFHVEKGNNPKPFDYHHKFNLSAESFGKELHLTLSSEEELKIWVFMGMNGNFKYVLTEDWNQTKFIRLRLDDETGHSLILFGGFMGPKYSVGKPFNGTKRGPDPTKDFENFKTNVIQNLDKKLFDKPICEVLLNQEYFSGIGNYIRSTILFYADVNPFQSARKIISENNHILDLCKSIPLESYKLHGGQLKDWESPFGEDPRGFQEWVFYQKGLSCKDKLGRTFWFHEKWVDECPYVVKNI